MKARDGVCLGILATIFLFYLLTIRSGQPWPDDFAMYIQEAKNFVDHTPIQHTNYLYDPYNPALGPRLYPPVFPLLLAPGYFVGGLTDLVPMQVEIVVFFTGILIVLWRGLGQELPPIEGAILLAIIGFNPVLWAFKDSIVSDIPFTFLLYLTLFLANDIAKDLTSKTWRVWKTLGLALLVYLCYGTRTVGIVLVPALLLCGFLYRRRNGGRQLVVAGLLAIMPCWIQSRIFTGVGYGDVLGLGVLGFVHTFVHNLVIYAWSLAGFWNNPYTKVLRDLIFAAVTFLALLAYFRRIRSGIRIYEILAPLYMFVILLFPYPGGARYLIPIFPLFVCYFLEGIEILRSYRMPVPRQTVLVPVLLLVVFSYGTEFVHSTFGPFRDGVEKPESKELFAFIKTQTNPSDVFIFRRPRALGLFTGRTAAVYPVTGEKYSAYFQNVHADYFIEAPALDDAAFDAFLANDCLSKRRVFSNADFSVFHITQSDLASCGDLAALSTR